MRNRLVILGAVTFAAGLSVGLVLPRPERPDADPAAKLKIEPQPGSFGPGKQGYHLEPVSLRVGDRVHHLADSTVDEWSHVVIPLRVNGVPAQITFDAHSQAASRTSWTPPDTTHRPAASSK